MTLSLWKQLALSLRQLLGLVRNPSAEFTASYEQAPLRTGRAPYRASHSSLAQAAAQDMYFFCPPAQRRQRAHLLGLAQGGHTEGVFAALPGRRAPRRIVTCRGLHSPWAARVRRQPAAERVTGHLYGACPLSRA